MKDTRAHPRFEIRVSAEIAPPEGAPFTCTTRDLSIGGVGLEHDRPLAEAAQVVLELFVVVDDIEDEATTPQKLLGQVVWCRMAGEHQYLSGIQFLDVTPDVASFLRKLVAATQADQA